MNDTKEIYEILRGEREPNTKAPAKKKAPACEMKITNNFDIACILDAYGNNSYFDSMINNVIVAKILEKYGVESTINRIAGNIQQVRKVFDKIQYIDVIALASDERIQTLTKQPVEKWAGIIESIIDDGDYTYLTATQTEKGYKIERITGYDVISAYIECKNDDVLIDFLDTLAVNFI